MGLSESGDPESIWVYPALLSSLGVRDCVFLQPLEYYQEVFLLESDFFYFNSFFWNIMIRESRLSVWVHTLCWPYSGDLHWRRDWVGEITSVPLTEPYCTQPLACTHPSACSVPTGLLTLIRREPAGLRLGGSDCRGLWMSWGAVSNSLNMKKTSFVCSVYGAFSVWDPVLQSLPWAGFTNHWPSNGHGRSPGGGVRIGERI